MDIIIPYIQSRWDGTELKYALRGVEKHLMNVENVVVVGDKPALKNIVYIPFKREPDRVYKERNIFEKVLKAVEDPRVSEDFLFMNDDHFILQDYEAKDFPNYYDNWPVKTDIYQQTFANSKPYVKEFFDIHCPMAMNKSRFIDKVAALDWGVPCGYCLKSVYACGLQGEFYRDLKFRLMDSVQTIRKRIEGGAWFSICDQARGPEMEAVLKELYPNKSKFE